MSQIKQLLNGNFGVRPSAIKRFESSEYEVL